MRSARSFSHKADHGCQAASRRDTREKELILLQRDFLHQVGSHDFADLATIVGDILQSLFPALDLVAESLPVAVSASSAASFLN
jgi:hypothetical protein